MRRAATLRLAWALLLTLAATVAIFVLDPIVGRTKGFDEPPEADDPWFARYGRWLGTVVEREIPRDPASAPFDQPSILTLVSLTLSATVAAYIIIVVTASVLTARSAERSRSSRVGTFVALLALAVPLGWLAATLAALAQHLNDAIGVDLLPTRAAVVFDMPWYLVGPTVVHHGIFRAGVLALVLTPIVVWWARQSPWFRTAGDARPDVLLLLMGRMLPFLAAGTLVIERAVDSRGLSDPLLRETWAAYAYVVASCVLVFGLALFGTRWIVELLLIGGVPEPARRFTRTARPERVRDLWSRIRQDHRARAGAASVIVVALLACYVRLWFSSGPHDVVSSGGATPPSLHHWLGIDPLGRDALVRLSAGIGGSAFAAVVAATFAVTLGFGWVLVTSRVPRAFGWTVLIIDLLAIPAAVWITLPGGRELHGLAFAGQRLTLALMLGAIATPLVARVVRRRCDFLLNSQNTPLRPAGLLTGLWFATVAGALLAEHLATFLLVQLDERSPTLGALLARTALELRTPGSELDPITTWPWLWFPPAVATAALVAGFALLARAALRPPR